MNHKSLNQLLCAATVNTRFREALLRDPARAIAAGYFDHSFSLTPEERDLVVGIRAQRLEDFAAQVYCWISSGGFSYSGVGHDGNGYNGKGHNGHNGRNGNGRKQDLFPAAEDVRHSDVDLYCVPVLAVC
jgi:hypothetical protein